MGCFTVVSFGASKTKKMTAYTQCIKDGNTVYCNTKGGIYKVNIKTGKKKTLVKFKYPAYESIEGMKLKKGYIYYSYSSLDDGAAICRVKTSGKSKKTLADFIWSSRPQFCVGKNKIYYKSYKDYDSSKVVKKKMKLNGKSKKKSSYNVKTKYKATNKSGYRVVEVWQSDSDICKYYLRKPNGKKIFLQKINYEDE
jgi:hypothetical protein